MTMLLRKPVTRIYTCDKETAERIFQELKKSGYLPWGREELEHKMLDVPGKLMSFATYDIYRKPKDSKERVPDPETWKIVGKAEEKWDSKKKDYYFVFTLPPAGTAIAKVIEGKGKPWEKKVVAKK